MAAHGESLKWDDYVPAPIPDEQNFYQAPMMTEWFVKSTNRSSIIPFNSAMSNPATLTNFFDEIGASNYLAWSAAFEPEFDQIRTALKRPEARMDGDYSKPFMEPVPNFVTLRAISQLLGHRAKCHLLLGEPAKALEDLTLLYDLNQLLVKNQKSALLVTAMIHTAVAAVYTDAIGCGIESHAWQDAQLAALQKQLAGIHLLPLAVSSFHNEQAHLNHLFDTSSLEKIMRGNSPSRSDLGWWFVPSGWVYQNKALIVTIQEQASATVNLTNETISPALSKAASASNERRFSHLTPWNYLAAMTTPNYGKAFETAARNQTWVDQAQIACAMERYRLANGNYPATLTALVPRYLEVIPHDIITGKPMPYQRISEQEYKLYSVGWNEIDEGGVTVVDSGGKEDRDHGDWVWHSPEQ